MDEGNHDPQANSPDWLAMVDRELQPVAIQMQRFYQQFTPMSLESLRLRREALGAMLGAIPADPPSVAVTERLIPGAAGSPAVRLYIVNAMPGAQRPAILHTHGGGFTASSAQGALPGLLDLASELDCTIVTVEFRNAPETRYDGSIEDNYAGLKWTYMHADELGVDPARIALMGESGGGGHAALLAIAARDRGEVPILFQSLIYPMLDDRTGSSRPSLPHRGVFNWNDDANRFGWECFLGQEPGTASVPTTAVPARVENLAGLPPTFIGVGALDIFVDESIAYAQRLLAAGVATELVVVPGAIHGFDMLAREADVSRRFAATKISALRRAFAR
jgi:acetyl esterase/lipase